ncbi:MAG: hypothetical protein ACWA5A_13850 [Marinibacterium sp.]
MSGINHGLSRFDQLIKACLDGTGPARPDVNVLGRILPPNPVHIKHITHADVIQALDDLTQSMRKTTNEDGPADAGMTFLAQFVDHDITLDVTSALGTRIDPATINNVRTPRLDLDNVYGAGPEGSPHLYGSGAADKFLVFGRSANPLDLARTCAGKALIGDPRNDENVIVAQVQGAFITLHNILMSKRDAAGAEASDITACAHDGMAPEIWEDHVHPRLLNFEEVRRFMRLHYQWVVWHEMLPAFVDQACLDAAWAGDTLGLGAPAMPVEFTGAAYRFGHATAQFEYRFTGTSAPAGLFAITGFGPRPVAGNIDMDLFFAMTGGQAVQKARPVGPGMASPLFELPFVIEEIDLKGIGEHLTLPQAKNLALRNMVRDRYTYELASGQQFARRIGVPDTLAIPAELAAKGFQKTPLWYWCLQEAETSGHGKLTGVGGWIVATVFANMLRRDPDSVMHVPHFSPWSGFGGHPSVLAGMLAYVEANRGAVTHAAELQCG